MPTTSSSFNDIITIIDTHVASLIAAAFLFQFGTGPIRGFATTLFFGLIANVFTAVFVSRTVFELDDDALIESAQLARDLFEVESLLPAMQAVRGGIGEVIPSSEAPCFSAVRCEAHREILQQRGDVVVELRARQRCAGREKRVRRHGLAPSAHHSPCAPLQVLRKSDQRSIGRRHGRRLSGRDGMSATSMLPRVCHSVLSIALQHVRSVSPDDKIHGHGPCVRLLKPRCSCLWVGKMSHG